MIFRRSVLPIFLNFFEYLLAFSDLPVLFICLDSFALFEFLPAYSDLADLFEFFDFLLVFLIYYPGQRNGRLDYA